MRRKGVDAEGRQEVPSASQKAGTVDDGRLNRPRAVQLWYGVPHKDDRQRVTNSAKASAMPQPGPGFSCGRSRQIVELLPKQWIALTIFRA